MNNINNEIDILLENVINNIINKNNTNSILCNVKNLDNINNNKVDSIVVNVIYPSFGVSVIFLDHEEKELGLMTFKIPLKISKHIKSNNDIKKIIIKLIKENKIKCNTNNIIFEN